MAEPEPPPLPAPEPPIAPREALADVRVRAPTRGNRRLEALATTDPLTRVLNRILRAGLKLTRTPPKRRHHREKTYPMGRPRIDLRKALAEATALEDEETLRKLTLRK